MRTSLTVLQLDDSAPQIKYFGNWSSYRDPKLDPAAVNYYRSTFHATATEVSIISVNFDKMDEIDASPGGFMRLTRQGDWMRLTFNGTAAWVYGSFWANHGAYSGELPRRVPRLSVKEVGRGVR